MKTVILTKLFVMLICTVGILDTKAQEINKDQNMDVRSDNVVRGCIDNGHCGDELTVGMESAKMSIRFLHGWKLRDAKISVGPIGDISPAILIDVQKRMGMTKSIDYLIVEIEVESLKGNEAIVFSRQKFSRILGLPDGTNRRRITGVTHREIWEKTNGSWKLKTFTEQDQIAKWEEEAQTKPREKKN